MLHRTRFEVEYARLYKEIKLGTTIWSPLACGLLSGKYSKGNIPADSRLGHGDSAWLKDQLLANSGINGLEEKNFDVILEKVEKLKPIAQELNCSLAQLAIAWTLKNPNVSTVITGASRKSQVEENLKALEVSKKLSDDVMERIEKVIANKPTAVRNFRS